jgi:hypothetical protein
MAKKNHKTDTIRIKQKDYYRIEELKEEIYGTSDVPTHTIMTEIIDQIEEECQ